MFNKDYILSRKTTKGFTIVELLVVIVVIAILAAITTQAYSGVQVRAKDNAIASDMRNFANKAEIYKVDNGTYPYANTGSLSALKYSVTQSAYPAHIDWSFEYCPNVARTEYILTAYLNSGEIMYVSSNNGAPQTYDARDIFMPGDDVAPPCYSGTPQSAADRAGLGQIGVLDAEQNVIGNPGTSGKGSTGWRTWATGGSS